MVRVVAAMVVSVLTLSGCSAGEPVSAGADSPSASVPAGTAAGASATPAAGSVLDDPAQDEAPEGEEPLTTVGPAEPTATEESGRIGTEELPAADVDEPVEVEAGVQVTVPAVRDLVIEAQGPGEVSGPGVAVVVKIANGSASAVDLNGVTVNIEVSDEPGVPSFSAPTDPFVGTLRPGRTARATYAFLLPGSGRAGLIVSVEFDDSENVVVVKP